MDHRVPPPAAMSLQGDVTENWKDFEAAWANYTVAISLDSNLKTAEGRDNRAGHRLVAATLCVIMGQESFKALQNLDISADDKAKPAPILTTLRNHFAPVRIVLFETHKFSLTESRQYIHRRICCKIATIECVM